jgi:hypothetical protein
MADPGKAPFSDVRRRRPIPGLACRVSPHKNLHSLDHEVPFLYSHGVRHCADFFNLLLALLKENQGWHVGLCSNLHA